jgi:hypothetical protein
MKYEVLKYEGKIEFEKLKNEKMVVSKSEVPVSIDGKNSIGSKVEIEESITLFDFFVRKKFTPDDIYELAEYTVNRLIPDASNEKKKEAKDRYLNDKRKSELKSFVFQLDKFAIIICKKDKIANVLAYLGIKQNMTTNLFLNLGAPIDDLLLWVCWATNNHNTFLDLKLRRISEDRTEDRSLKARSQKELGGNQISDSFDFKYRIGGGYPLNGLKFEVEETNLGTHLEIGIFVEDKGTPMITVSSFVYLRSGIVNKQIQSNPNLDKEILKMNIAVDVIYKLVGEYKNDINWATERVKFVNSQLQEAGKLFQGNQSGGQSP